MSSRRSIFVLLLALVALAAANVLVRRGREPASAARRTLLSHADEATRLAIERPASPAVVLEKGEGWRFVKPFAGSVDAAAVARLLDALAFEPVTDVLSDAELLRLGRTRADFSLVEPLVRVAVTVGGETTVVAFGAPTPSADGVYAAVEGVPAVFVAPSEAFAAVDRPASDFRRRAAVSLAADAVAAFDVKRGTGSILAFVREDDGWRVSGAKASERKVQSLLAALTSAAAVDFVWPVGASNETDIASSALLAGYGLDPENAVTVTLKGLDGGDRQIVFGKSVDEGRVYALVQNGAAVVTLPTALRDAAAEDAVMFADSRLFPVEAQDVALFSVADGETACALARDADGTWRLESPISAPAEKAVAEEVLRRILALAPFDADPAGLSVSVSTNAAAVKVSRARVLGNYGFKDLRAREIVRLDPERVKRIVRTPLGPDAKPDAVIYSRERRSWNVEAAEGGVTADEKGIASVVDALNPLVAVRIERLKVPASALAAYGLDRPFLTVAVDQDREDAVRRNILIGERTAGGRYATVGSSDAVFVISDDAVSRLAAAIVDR